MSVCHVHVCVSMAGLWLGVPGCVVPTAAQQLGTSVSGNYI